MSERPRIPHSAPLVVMGVTASGKTMVARGLAIRVGGTYLDGDDLHPMENIMAMADGIPLTDEDRWPWLDALGSQMAHQIAAGHRPVVACSALKRIYRDRLRDYVPNLGFVFLEVPVPVLEARLAARQGHFMAPSLLASQVHDLEPPQADEAAVVIDGSQQSVQVVADAMRALATT